MSAMLTVSGDLSRWADIGKLFDTDERHDAAMCLLEDMKDPSNKSAAQSLVKDIAKATGTRQATIEARMRANPRDVANLIATRAAAVLDDGSWRNLYRAYYFHRKSALLCAFLDGIGVAHDRRGGVEGAIIAPAPDVLKTTVEVLLRSFSVREVVRYFTVLVRHDPIWAFVVDERDRLLQSLEIPALSAEHSAVQQAASAAASSGEFGVLDQVLIEQIVRTAMGIEGCLHPAAVEELVESLIRLSEKWLRAYFHLGFMDVLLPERDLRFDHTGDNQERRSWYLAGVIAGLVRGNDLDGLAGVLEARKQDLIWALNEHGGPGASIVRTSFRRIAEAGRIDHAILAIRGQAEHLGLEFAYEALEIAADFIRQSQFESAKVIVDELARQELDSADRGALVEFKLVLSRRRGQCLQAVGDFEGAERGFRQALSAGEELSSPDLLSDLGLVKGRFRTVAELRIPDDQTARVTMREALQRGEEYYKRAAAQFGDSAPKAAHALALLGYLRWWLEEGKRKEERRALAAELASRAVTSMLASEYAAYFRQIGSLGQGQFMLAATRMGSLDEVQAREALAVWQTITGDAGKFPLEDVKRLLEAAEVYGPDIADPVAESILDYRRDEALEILKATASVTRSRRIYAGLTEMARQESLPRAERLRLWMLLVPLLIRGGEIAGAEEGLGEIERLAETDEDFATVFDFIGARSNYDPAWSEAEAGMARVYMLRKLGRDGECAEALRLRFYATRDAQPWEAEQILVMFDDWTLDPRIREELRNAIPRTEVATHTGVDDRLRAGEKAKLLFVGGNEMQAQYDKTIQEQIAAEWPGILVQFEHTGWSSNWGRELPRLTEDANRSDAVVLMPYMRTNLGRRLRAALKKPWLACTSTGKAGMLLSLRQAARLVVRKRIEEPVGR